MSGYDNDNTVNDTIVHAYMAELHTFLVDLPSNLQPDANQISVIVTQDLSDLRQNLIPQSGLTDTDLALTDVSWLSHHNPLQRLGQGINNAVKRNSKEVCIITHIAIGAAILAAWVASGGTLAIGSVVAGVTITQPLIAALAGGASGAVLAKIMCD